MTATAFPRLWFGVIALITFVFPAFGQTETPAYLNPEISFEERANDLLSRMTVEEKISQLNYTSAAIDRLDVPQYNWWNEALHGVGRNGRATIFPQAIALAATFDTDLVHRVADAISDEGRAKYNASVALGNRVRYTGLSFWSPNINIFRDPRWGRGQETYGEDPYLTSRMGVAFVQGLQGFHPKYLKSAACAKHFVVHSGPEGDRHHFNAKPSQKDFRETYLPAFEALVTEANVEAVMCAYNRTFDEPCCGNSYLLKDILREEWGFNGHIVSDCWALVDIHTTHEFTKSEAESAALAFKTGVNVDCGSTSPALIEAVKQKLITEAEINQALRPLLMTRFKLGLFDPAELNPYSSIGPEVINSDQHRQLAREAAEKAVVLLKNNGILPLSRNIPRLHVLGPNATNTDVLMGNYHGVSGNMHTILEGITDKVNPGTQLRYNYAFLQDRENINPIDWSTGDAQEADAIIVVMGLSGLLEGEEGESLASSTKSDRTDIALPSNQINYLRKLRQAGTKPIIVVLTGGSAVAIPEVHEIADAVLYAWYPGEEGGNAVANLLFGEANPSGRLPVTFYASTSQLPAYDDYSMKGRTYRYMTETPLYPFGFGLSYTTFSYSNLKFSNETIKSGENTHVSVTVTNTGNRAGEEVVQLYLSDVKASVTVPNAALKGFKRVMLKPGESKVVTFTLLPADMEIIDNEGIRKLESGEFRVRIGGSSPGAQTEKMGGAKLVEGTFRVK
ncbi:MAG: glycoside hydrolase family 3 C-terminal domain-containing protein [Bacteroidia bacterium]|nr:glycoside hydrolase family 3 C-terminal domain-containing protein [Bacteroidia bacterium]